jgi:hypothetical protein
MVRSVRPLVCIFAIVGLTVCGFAEPARQDAKAKAEAKVDAKAAKAEAKAAAMAKAIEANIQEFEMELGPGIRQMYRAELHLMRVIAQPTKEQYDKIAADADAVVKAAVRRYAEASTTGRNTTQLDPRAVLADAVAGRVRTVLTPEQVDRYRKELDQRAEDQRQARRVILVARVDKLLLLTPEQRDKLSDILDKNWDRSWDQAQWLHYDGQLVFPLMPDAKILPILTDAQKAVWRTMKKQNVQFGIDFDIGPGILIDDEVWDGPPKDAPKPAEGKAADKAVPKGARR